jgi:hypothetical protein
MSHASPKGTVELVDLTDSYYAFPLSPSSISLSSAIFDVPFGNALDGLRFRVVKSFIPPISELSARVSLPMSSAMFLLAAEETRAGKNREPVSELRAIPFQWQAWPDML